MDKKLKNHNDYIVELEAKIKILELESHQTKIILKNIPLMDEKDNKENYNSTSDELLSVRPKRKLFKWDNNEIPFEITIDSRRHYSNVMKIIEDINVNLEGCIKFRFVQTIILNQGLLVCLFCK